MHRPKMNVVKSDFYETSGIRQILNFGHTIGHLIEAASTILKSIDPSSGKNLLKRSLFDGFLISIAWLALMLMVAYFLPRFFKISDSIIIPLRIA